MMRTFKAVVAASLALVALDVQFEPCLACSTFVLNQSLYPDQVISARTMDFASFGDENAHTPIFGMVAARKGSRLPVFVVQGTAESGPSPRTLEEDGLEVKLDFYCASLQLTPDLIETFYLPNANNGFGVCSDGMNEAGVSLNVHWDEVMGEVGEYNPSSKRPAINFLDVPAYILAQFSTIEEVLEAFPGPGKNIDLVINPAFKELSPQLLGESTKVHMMVTDATGKSAVLEWTNNTYDEWSIVINPHGVITNTPQLAAQVQMLHNLEPKLEAKCKEALANDYNEGPYQPGWDCEGLHKSFFFTGLYESPDRFQRAVLLNRGLAGLYLANPDWDGRFPNFVPWSPGYRNDTNKAALMAAMQIQNTLAIPGNIATGPESWTQYSTLRDHKNLKYYIRPGGATLFSEYSLADLKELPEGSVKFDTLAPYVSGTPFAQKFHPRDLRHGSTLPFWSGWMHGLRLLRKLIQSVWN